MSMPAAHQDALLDRLAIVQSSTHTFVHQVCLVLGSNIEPQINLPRALALLEQLFTTLRVSRVYETPALGSPGPNFWNAAVLVQTALPPQMLKERVLRPLEAFLGRVRSTDKNAARTIDIDIVAWDGTLIDNTVWRQAHLAVPVAELLPEIKSDRQGETLQQVADYLWATQPIQLIEQVFHQAHRHDRRADNPRSGVHTQHWGNS
jgi:2-amino-4-hydroxy-6-hydroxymethyldihydropteridine diphosphokinase